MEIYRTIIIFYDVNNNVLSVLSTEKPTTNSDGTNNQLKITHYNETINEAIDNNTSTKWWSGGTYGSMKFTLSDIPHSYTFTTGNDNDPYNRTPTVWHVTYNGFTNQEDHTGEQYYTSNTQQNFFTLPENDQFAIPN